MRRGRRFTKRTDTPAPAARRVDIPPSRVDTPAPRKPVSTSKKPSVPAPSPLDDNPPPSSVVLPPRQAAFVDHYLACLNATEAARRAGYSAKTADVQGPRLLGNVRVGEEIRKRRAAMADKLELTRDEWLLALRRLGLSDMGNYMRADADGSPVLSFAGLTPDHTAALQEVTVEEFKDGRSDKREVRRTKFKLADKRGPLELIGKSMGWLKDEVDHRHKHVHEHSLMGALLLEIDGEQRGRVIEHDPAERKE